MAVPESELLDSLNYTPTWVVAAVCIVIVAISLCAERGLHYLGQLLKNKRQDALSEALQKLKEELMLLGFISLLLTAFQGLISHICIPPRVVALMLPCKNGESFGSQGGTHHGKDFSHGAPLNRRLLSETAGYALCTKKGKLPLLSLESLHHLHMFIFVLAVVHVVFCASTMVLGGAKIRRWKQWEETIRKENSEQENVPTNEIQVNISTPPKFVKDRAMGFRRKSVVVSWMMSFFKQFHASVTKSDYNALRSGFIMKHCSSNPNFDFHKYMMRTLEDDFKIVVGISWYLWLFVVVFLLLNLNGWHTYFWLSFLPLILLLAVGAKLEYIITRMAQEVAEQAADDQQAQRVKPSDHHFWFRRPGIVLYLIHFILFQNSFEIAFFIWIWSTYGFHSCIMEKVGYIVPRLVIGVLIQVLCSYSTLPLYAVVTQMGDMFKQAILTAQLRSTLHDWVEDVRKRKRSRKDKPSFQKMFGNKNRGQNKSGVKMHKIEPAASGSPQDADQQAVLAGIVECEINESETQVV